MRLIDSQDNHDPYLNLALEEYAVRHLDPGERFLLFYINDPAIIIGKHQNTIEQVNAEHVEAHGVHVVRRISGGGAVYHDRGNLNFSFITHYRQGDMLDFESFTGPVVRVLNQLGVSARLTGRNDIVVGERKISGNAQFTTAQRMFSHGTLLFDSNLDHVQEALRVKASKIQSKGVPSIRSRVANIREFLGEALTLEEFRARLIEGIFDGAEPVRRVLEDHEWQAVRELADDKYRQWQWNYGESPRCNIQRVRRFPIGEVDARIEVKDGQITALRFFGDFLGLGELGELEQALVGVPFRGAELTARLAEHDIERLFGGLDRADLLELLLNG